jgi:hypothetical protein
MLQHLCSCRFQSNLCILWQLWRQAAPASCHGVFCDIFCVVRSLALSVYYGGRMNGSIDSMPFVMCGNCCKAFSRFDRCKMFAVLTLRALSSHCWIGWFTESDYIAWSLEELWSGDVSIMVASLTPPPLPLWECFCSILKLPSLPVFALLIIPVCVRSLLRFHPVSVGAILRLRSQCGLGWLPGLCICMVFPSFFSLD